MKTIYKISEEHFEEYAAKVENNNDIIDAYNNLTVHYPQVFFETEDLAKAEAEFAKCKPKVYTSKTYHGFTLLTIYYYSLEAVKLDDDGEEVDFEILAEKFGEIE